jgi:trans-2,3-dihydro-3-hydroxyanthranilate isomerase
MSTLAYELCDVFTDRPLKGNALAVFTDANGIDTMTMQALAREMNLSESAFVLRPTAKDADARIRIFTPTMELPFAGHPTLGTAFVLAGKAVDETVVRLETARGIASIRMTGLRSSVGFGWMTQPIPARQVFAPIDELLSALGVRNAALPVELYDNGPRYVLIGLESPQEVAALRPDLSRLSRFGSQAFVVFARNADRWKARVFAPGEGIPEDPATGAAAGPLAVHLARYGYIAFGEEIAIDQGAEIGRPSTLHARALGSAERVEAVEVGGNAVVVARGEFTRC